MTSTHTHFLARAYAAFADDPQPAAAFLRWAAAAHNLPATPTLLDIGTGPGVLLGHLAAQGWQAHGLEPNPYFVAYARQQGAASVTQGAFYDLEAQSRYHMVTGLGSPLAYLPDYRTRRDALQRVWHALRPGGLAIMEVWNLPRVLRHYAPPLPITTTLGGHTLTLTRTHTFDDHHAAMTQHERYTLDGHPPAELTHTLYMLTIPDIIAAYEEVGFTPVSTYPGYQARTPDPIMGSRGLIMGVKG